MKLHLSMRVEDLESAKMFYSSLFNQPPTLIRENYIKWDVKDPAVNFVVESGRGDKGFDHVGIQVTSDTELQDLAVRMKQTDHKFLDIENTDCCFANMDKAWIKGSANENWEAFLTHHQDSQDYGTDRTDLLEDCCTTSCC
ncbi:MAG: hypothetical protein ACI8P9_000763 [Parasphingorhabdus sp.]|jgi:extradiol dioxygenase family protein